MINCEILWTKLIYNSIILFIFVHHLNVNFFLIISKKNFFMKSNLLAVILFLIKNFDFPWTSLILKKFLEKKKLCSYKSKRLISMVLIKEKKIIRMEIKKENVRQDISKLNKKFLKKQLLLMKKFKKFYQDYLGIALKILNNIFVWRLFDSNRSCQNFFFIILVKIKKIYCFNLKTLRRKKYQNFLKKEIKKKNSVSRALLLLK